MIQGDRPQIKPQGKRREKYFNYDLKQKIKLNKISIQICFTIIKLKTNCLAVVNVPKTTIRYEVLTRLIVCA